MRFGCFFALNMKNLTSEKMPLILNSMNPRSTTFPSAATALSASLCLAENPKGGVLFIAGGGAYTKEFYREWQEDLAENGYHSLAFDFPGIGASSGHITATSLNSRLHDATNAFDWFARETGLPNHLIFPCGRSMGGPLALRLTQEKILSKTILLYPAAYAEAAYDKLFGPSFSEVIRQKNSWQDSPDFELAQKCHGELLVIYGEKDAIIPKEIQNRYLDIAKTKGSALLLQEAGHNQYLWETDPTSVANRAKLFEATRDFLLPISDSSTQKNNSTLTS